MCLRKRRKLLERRFLATGDEGGEDAAGLVAYDGRSVQRASRYEHEAARSHRDGLVAGEERELAREDVEHLVGGAVDVRRRGEAGQRRSLEEPDRAGRLIGGGLSA